MPSFLVSGIERLSPGDYLFIRDKSGSGKPEDDHLYAINVDLRYVLLMLTIFLSIHFY